MKYAIFGDIHANLEALEAVLVDAAEQDCSNFICMGDIVGYNANPTECLNIVRDLDSPTIKGNHDEEASIDTPLEGLNPLAAAAMTWTRNNISEEDKQWLRELRLMRQVRDFTVVHATLDSPDGWGYVMNKFDAMASMSYQFTDVCFCGHTHVPVGYEKTDTVREITPGRVELAKGNKYFFNVGSVGQPRDGDWRASYAIYDVDEAIVEYRRLDYDLRTAQDKIIAAGLPEMLANRLALGK